MCRRPVCQRPAVATLTFHYQCASVLLMDLVEERHPSRWDMCALHADSLRVPLGWDHVDERGEHGRVADTSVPAGDAPDGDETPDGDEAPSRNVQAGTVRPGQEGKQHGDRRARNRYSKLAARLPAIAAQLRAAATASAPSEATASGTSEGIASQTPQGRWIFPEGIAAVDVPPVIPGQLEMLLPGLPRGPRGPGGARDAMGAMGADDGYSGEQQPNDYSGNVVPLIPRPKVLDTVP